VEAARKAGDDKRRKLKECIDLKLEHADMKREARLGKIQDRIRIHVRTPIDTSCSPHAVGCSVQWPVLDRK